MSISFFNIGPHWGARLYRLRDRFAFGVQKYRHYAELFGFCVAAAIVFIAYSLTLAVANTLSFWDAILAGAANAVPTVIFGSIAYGTIAKLVVSQRPIIAVVAHLLICTCFALLSYWLLLVMLGALSGASVMQFEVRPFISRAMAWQTLLNVTIYGMIAVLAHNRHRRDSSPDIPAQNDDEVRKVLSRYFIRNGDDAVPVEIGDIVSISGADDYTEINTLHGKHLARMTLARFAELLDPTLFVRVHRSHIVNLDHVMRLEPSGGGRLLVHMSDDYAINASRAGSTHLRERIL